MNEDVLTRLLNLHYSSGNVILAIDTALRNAGKDPATLGVADLEPVDQFHLGRAEATRDLAQLAKLQPGQKVLDIGGGLGGPARQLARDFGCQVSVLDLTEEYCRAGAKLTEWTGLTDHVSFHHGNAMSLPFDTEAFDVAWMQHATMNIDDPGRLYDGIHWVLRPGGIYALYEIMEGDGSPIIYPVPWARDPALSWVQHPDAARSLLADRGFRESTWEDVSAETLARVQRQLAVPSASPLGLQLVVGPDFPSLFRNLVRNLQEGKIRIIRATFERG